MNKLTIILTLTCCMIATCNSTHLIAQNGLTMKTDKQITTTCTDNCMTKNKPGEVTCKLTSPELQKRKETVIASLKQQIIEKKELKNGYAFRFSGSDKMLDELTEFIKAEIECCDFFTFGLTISGDKNEVWLELSGEEGVKDFITLEIGF